MFATAARQAHARTRQGFQMWMPHMPMVLMKATNATSKTWATAVFRVLPKMTKHEIKEHLTEIYKLPVLKVHTAQFLGARKRIMGRYKMAYYKYPKFKRAVVFFDESVKEVNVNLDA
jgi:ribosomal protein L23